MEAFGNNFIYVLKDNSLFSPIEYKVLGNQSDAIFARAMKIVKNGCISIFYLTENLVPLSKENAKFDENKLSIVIKKILLNAIEIKNNGFLSCKNLIISLDEIFINPTSLEVKFIYIPTSEHVFEDEMEFDNKLRSELIKLIDSNSELLSDRLLEIKAKLYDSRLSFKDVCDQINGRTTPPTPTPTPIPTPDPIYDPSDTPTDRFGGYKFVPDQPALYPEIAFAKTMTVIGKSPEQSDISIPNNAVSRRHCSVTMNDKCIYIVDEGSKNGTYVNGVRLIPNMPMQLTKGDEIKMAQVVYHVVAW